jgi:hypothetical protein
VTIAESSTSSTVSSGLSMVECVGCRNEFKNDKSYRNHQRSCTKYAVEAARRLRLKREIIAKKAEALANFQVIAAEEYELQPATGSPDLETPMDVVSCFCYLESLFYDLTSCRTMLSLNCGHQAGLSDISFSLHATKMERLYQNPDIGDVLNLTKMNYQPNRLPLRPPQQSLTLHPSNVPKYTILPLMKIPRPLSDLCLINLESFEFIHAVVHRTRLMSCTLFPIL